MTSPSGGPHPTTELISDLLEGLVPPAEGRAVALHLDQCPTCQAVRDSLVHTHRVLSQTGRTPAPMPPDVFARVESSLREEAAARSGSTGVASLSDARERRRPRWAARALAAAAAVVVLGGGGALAYQVVSDSGPALEAGSAPSDDSDQDAEDQDAAPGDGGAPGTDDETASPGAAPDDQAPRALTMSTFDDGVRELLDQRPSLSDETGPGAEPEPATTLSPALMACVSEATTQAGAGQLLVAGERTLDDTPVVLAVTTSRNADEVHAYAVAGCEASSPEVIHDEAVSTK